MPGPPGHAEAGLSPAGRGRGAPHLAVPAALENLWFWLTHVNAGVITPLCVTLGQLAPCSLPSFLFWEAETIIPASQVVLGPK